MKLSPSPRIYCAEFQTHITLNECLLHRENHAESEWCCKCPWGNKV
jgi:hypothetical protein